MRLIDADALLKAVEKERQFLLERGQTGAEHILVHHCLPLIDNAPTIIWCSETSEGYPLMDLRPREEGEWINHRNDNGHNIADCSLCGKTTQWHDEDEDGIPRYCWYCGAEMKGGKENG